MADPRIGGLDEVKAAFYCPKNRHGKVLIRCRSPSEPSIIGDIDEKGGLFLFIIPCGLREDCFITDQDPQAVLRAAEWVLSLTRPEVANPCRELVHEGEEAPERHILAVGNKMHLVIASLHGTGRREQVGAVQLGNICPA